ncbi:MAG: DUF1795 domain-containing protein [Methanosarcinales archaeon]|nr:DUF1795 domain-containing protein [Methanosarcinales archaeon]
MSFRHGILLAMLVLLAIGAAVGAACAQSCPAPSSDDNETDSSDGGEAEEAPVDTSGAVGISGLQSLWLYENQEYGFSAKYPEGWEAAEPDPNEMGMVAGFLAPGEDMEDPQNYVVVQVEELSEALTLDQYVQAALSSLRSDHPDLQVLSDQQIAISGIAAREMVYTVDQGAFKVLQVMVVKENRAYLITFNALAERYPDLEAHGRTIVGSFEFM